MTRMLYVLTHDPKDRPKLVSSVFAQALTALSFGYEAEIFLMDRAVKTAAKGYVDGLKAESFAYLQELIDIFMEMEGKLSVCAPFAQHQNIRKENCMPAVMEFVDAGMLAVHAKNSVVFTY
jgi:predicted peroxiredoxin